MPVSFIAAFILWSLMFFFRIADFWLLMSLSASALALYALTRGSFDRKKLFAWRSSWLGLGLISAMILYLVFWLGNLLSSFLFDFAPSQMEAIYNLGIGKDLTLVGLLLVFPISPAEEILWRGHLQGELQKRLDPTDFKAWLLGAFLYASVHIWALNFILFIAALICGLFWGFLFWRTGNLWPGIISHAIWDLAIFVLFPVT